jgi:benzodiazapine receptor
MSGIHIPNILLTIPRNPVTAVGLPLTLGFFSGFTASKGASIDWYHVCSINSAGSSNQYNPCHSDRSCLGLQGVPLGKHFQ